jgi:uncharacterized RDD family membrane protein YckC
LLSLAVAFVPFVAGIALMSTSEALGFLMFAVATVAYIGFSAWNSVWKQGAEGWTIGKQKMGIKVLREQDGAVAGWPTALGRALFPQVINFFCGIFSLVDYLWPLWDEPKKQRLTDKVFKLVVVRVN